jgi:hypothetical protein
MKTLIAIASFIVLTAFAAQAQTTILLSGTDQVAAGLSNTTSTITHTKAGQLAVVGSFKLTGAGTSGVLFRFDTSVDNSTWATGVKTFWAAGNGTTAVTVNTNFDFGAYPFIRCQIHNTNSVIATNWSLKVFSKPNI